MIAQGYQAMLILQYLKGVYHKGGKTTSMKVQTRPSRRHKKRHLQRKTLKTLEKTSFKAQKKPHSRSKREEK